MSTTDTSTETRGGNVAAPFDPTPYLKQLSGKPYLEVVRRIQWLRSDHPEAAITTRLEHIDFPGGWAVFHARVEIPGAGVAEGTGSETRTNFPEGWLEKAETIAIGRALAALGYGTAFALADFEEGHLSDSPVKAPTSANAGHTPATPQALADAGKLGPEVHRPSSNLATPAQLKLIYLAGTRDLHLTEEEIEERAHAQYGRLPLHLSKREASEFIDDLKAASNGTARAAR